MRLLSETNALEKLLTLKTRFAGFIRDNFEHRAKDCSTCETKGACCLDAHFVNVHITRLEAMAIRNVIDELPERNEVYDRIDRVISQYDLSTEQDTFAQTYACPLFDRKVGCLVHNKAKPLPCVSHACYENKKDLPPDDLLVEQQANVEKLNELTYRKPARWLPLPLAVKATDPVL